MSSLSFAKSRRGATSIFLVETLAPVLIYCGLHLAGMRDVVSLMAGGMAGACISGFAILRNDPAKRISILVSVLFFLAMALVLLTGDPRVVLLKPSIYATVIGVYFLLSLRGRPALLDASEPFATKDDTARHVRWHAAWHDSTSFRRSYRLGTALCGLLLILEGIARAAIILREPPEQAVLLANVPLIVLLVALGAVGRFLLRPAAREAMGEA